MSGITVGGHTFATDGPIITRGRVKLVIGVGIDTLDLTIDARPTDLVNGTSFLQALREGAFDGAHVKVERCIMLSAGDTSPGSMVVFTGRVADLSLGRSQAQVRVNSDLELLNVQLPRNLFQPGCVNTLFDGGCLLDKASYAVAGIVTAATLNSVTSALSNPSGYFTLGTLTFTSGALDGTSVTVKSYASGTFQLLNLLLAVPTPGDTFVAYPGCDKQKNTCSGKFSNIQHFRGTPFVPTPESVL